MNTYPWSLEEEYLLVETYLQFKDTFKMPTAIKDLSFLLRKYGNAIGRNIDTRYRNQAGIRMKLMNISYLITYGAKGLSNTSDLDKKVVEEYFLNPTNFQNIVSKIKQEFKKIIIDFEVNGKVSTGISIFTNTCTHIENTSENQLLVPLVTEPAIITAHSQNTNCKIEIEKLNISNRLKNVLFREKILYLDQFLSLSKDDIAKMKNAGQKTIAEALQLAQQYANSDILEYKNTLNESDDTLAEIYKLDLSVRAHNLLIQNNITSFYDLAVLKDSVIEAWRGAGAKTINEIKHAKKQLIETDISFQSKIVVDSLQSIHPSNESFLIDMFFNKSTSDKLKSNHIVTIKNLKLCDEQKIQSLNISYHLLCAICSKLSVDYLKKFREHFENIIKNPKKNGELSSGWERTYQILLNRARGLTLELSIQEYGLTRERARQIEKKALSKFTIWYSKNKDFILEYLKSLTIGNAYFSKKEIQQFIGAYYEIFIYFISQQECEIHYIEELNIFYIKDELNWYDELVTMASSLPDTLDKLAMENEIKNIHKNLGDLGIIVPYDFCTTIIEQEFKRYGEKFTRYNLTLAKKYAFVLKEYFPDGINIYNDFELNNFRTYYDKMFKDAKMSLKNRALASRIASICILCGKGQYKLKQNEYISSNLLSEIYEYIVSNDKDLFLTNSLLYVFEEKLLAEGVDNKYYLQGILKHAFHNKGLYFSKDYISKTKDFSTIAKDIVKFIKESNTFVSDKTLHEEYPGVADSIFVAAFSDESIVHYANYCVSVDALKVKNETMLIDSTTEQMVADREIHSTTDLFNYLSLMHENVIEELHIDNRYSLATIMIALFDDKYEIKRPFFAAKGIEILNEAERIQDFVDKHEEIEVSDIVAFLHDNHFRYERLLNVLSSINGYVFKDKEWLIKEQLTGINKYHLKNIEDLLNDICEDDIAVFTNKKIWCYLPQINIFWNEWLLYSIITKYSNSYKVILSNNQFRASFPIFIKKTMPINTIEELNSYLKYNLNLTEEQLFFYLKRRGILR